MNRRLAWGEISSTAGGGLQLTPQAASHMAGDSSPTTGSGHHSLEQPGDLVEKPGNGILRVLSNRLAESGAHGIPNIQRANSSFRRLAWTVLFLAGLGMFAYQGSSLIIKYYSYPYNVNIEIRTLKQADFPAVTMCNLNPVRKDALLRYPDLCNLLSDGPEGCSPVRSNSTNQEYGGYSDWNKTQDTIDYNAEDSAYEMLETTTDIVGALSYYDRGLIGHQLNETLLRCTFERKHCSPRNFTQFYNARYGNCFTFNGVKAKPLQVTKTGPTYGLSMELYIQQDQYITDVETGAGVRILVHNQTDMPFPEDDGGANISPGTETFIGLYRTLINRLPLPYGDCATDFRDGNIFRQKFPGLEYTKNACEKDCFFQDVLSECKCADVYYRYNDSQPACNSTVKEIDSCIDEVERRFINGSLNCDHCMANCNETRYELSYSSSMWPNRRYAETVRKKIKTFNTKTTTFIGENNYFIEENVLRVNIYYDGLNYDDIFQSPAYTVSSMVSDLGGQVGLWIGVSVLTLCEFLELVLDICLLVMVRCRAGGERLRGMTDKVDKVRPQS